MRAAGAYLQWSVSKKRGTPWTGGQSFAGEQKYIYEYTYEYKFMRNNAYLGITPSTRWRQLASYSTVINSIHWSHCGLMWWIFHSSQQKVFQLSDAQHAPVSVTLKVFMVTPTGAPWTLSVPPTPSLSSTDWQEAEALSSMLVLWSRWLELNAN